MVRLFECKKAPITVKMIIASEYSHDRVPYEFIPPCPFYTFSIRTCNNSQVFASKGKNKKNEKMHICHHTAVCCHDQLLPITCHAGGKNGKGNSDSVFAGFYQSGLRLA